MVTSADVYGMDTVVLERLKKSWTPAVAELLCRQQLEATIRYLVGEFRPGYEVVMEEPAGCPDRCEVEAAHAHHGYRFHLRRLGSA